MSGTGQREGEGKGLAPGCPRNQDLSGDQAAEGLCPICGGKGEVIVIDEDVGCQVPMPCWSCQRNMGLAEQEPGDL